MPLVQKYDIADQLGISNPALTFSLELLMALFKVNALNYQYDLAAGYDGREFVEKVLHDMGNVYEVDEGSLQNIPREGKFVAVSNHPYGMLDGLIMIHCFSGVRPEFKMMTNYLLDMIQQLRSFTLPVNPFEKGRTSIKGVRNALAHLKNNQPIGMFPAGEVSSIQKKEKHIADKEWNKSMIRLIIESKAVVVPVYFEGYNSTFFHLSGLLHPACRSALLVREFIKMKNRKVSLRIGKPILPDEYLEFNDATSIGKYIRAHTYSLSTGFDKPNHFSQKVANYYNVVQPIKYELLQKEIDNLHQDSLLIEKGNYRVYVARAKQIPFLLREIGRLRELTFRHVGEGTNKAIDLDCFDDYYQHLFVWDTNTKNIIGAYRIGVGSEIFPECGKKGFYTHTLFKFKKEFEPFLKEGVELGRSFVVDAYQKRPLPLLLLWQGILALLKQNPQINYIIGPVSLANSYSSFSKTLTYKFLNKYYSDDVVAKHVQPRKKYNPQKFNKIDFTILQDQFKGDFSRLEKFISGTQSAGWRLPVLFKKYLAQQARVIGFNIDSKFNNALDVLMLLKISNIPDVTYKMLDEDIRKKPSKKVKNKRPLQSAA